MPQTVREFVYSVSTLLGDRAPQFRRYSESSIVNAANDGQRAIAKFLPSAFSRVDSIKLRAGVMQSLELIAIGDAKDLTGAANAVALRGVQVLDVIGNMGSDGATPGAAITPVLDGREALDSQNSNWMAATGAAPKNWLYDPRTPRHFMVTPPVPAAGQTWARVSWVALPTAIVNTGTPGAELYAWAGANAALLGVPDQHTDDLLYYTVARLLMENAQLAGATGMSAQQYVDMFVASINATSVAIQGHNPNLKTLPFAPSPIGAAT